MKKILVLVILGTCFTGCSRPEQKQTAAEPAPATMDFQGPVSLALKGEKGRKEITTNCSHTETEAYEEKNILRKRIEDLDFKVRTITKDVSPQGTLIQDTETLKKDGPGSLHDLAYPEEGEVIAMETDTKGKILKAGRYPKDSLFFLPAVPLPDHPVKQNEEWVSRSSWRSENSGIPLEVELRLKVTGQKRCGDHECYNVAVNGEVHFPKIATKNQYSHKITGRFLFEPERGLVPWSEFLSDELVQGKGARAVVHAKLRSELVEPPGYRTASREEPSCPFETKAE